MTEKIEVTQETTAPVKKCSKLPTVLAIIFFAALAVSAYYNYLWFNEKKGLAEDTSEKAKKIAGMIQTNSQLTKEISLLKTSKSVVKDSLNVVMESNKAKDVLIDRLNQENVTLKIIKEEVDKIKNINLSIESSNKQLQEVQQKISKTISEKQNENDSFKKRLK